MADLRSNYESTKRRQKTYFFLGIILFVILDTGLLIGLIVPKVQLLTLFSLFMTSLFAYGMYVSGPYVGISKKASGLIAILCLISVIIILAYKGFI
jgi:hypothetical protein